MEQAMNRIRWIAVSIVLGISLISPAANYAYEDPGIGEYVNVAPRDHNDWMTPPGHYGLMALYANDFLSNATLNGNYLVSWTFVKANLSDYFIVDVRPTGYCSGHISGAVNIPYAAVAEPYNLEKLPTDKPILVVCGSGALSSQAGSILGMMGYQVRILIGGMTAVPATDRVTCP